MISFIKNKNLWLKKHFFVTYWVLTKLPGVEHPTPFLYVYTILWFYLFTNTRLSFFIHSLILLQSLFCCSFCHSITSWLACAVANDKAALTLQYVYYSPRVTIDKMFSFKFLIIWQKEFLSVVYKLIVCTSPAGWN